MFMGRLVPLARVQVLPHRPGVQVLSVMVDLSRTSGLPGTCTWVT